MAEYQPGRRRPAEQDRGFIENAVTDEKCCLLVAETEGYQPVIHTLAIKH
ncbi:hypothetical protein ACISK3_02830 [Morganella morganii]